jgi:hypothetical protein
MPSLDPAAFDPTRPLAIARHGTLNGHVLHAAAPVKVVDEPAAPGDLLHDDAARLWAAGRIVYAEDARPTPVEKPEQAARRLTVVEPLGDDKHLIRAPWLREGEIVTGTEATALRRDAVIAQGIELFGTTAEISGETAAANALGGDGFVITEAGSNGYYDITGPGLTEPERVRGRANAEARLAELRGAASKSDDADE